MLIFGHSHRTAAVASPDTSFYITHNVANNGDTFTIKCSATGVYNAVIDWGDGTQSTITAWNDPDLTHTYATAGRYSARVTGTLERLNFDSSSDSAKLVSITGGPASVGVDQITVSGSNTMSQDVETLPRSCTYLHVEGNNTLGGDVAGLPRDLGYIRLQGANTLSGDLAGLPARLATVYIFGSNTISGDVADLPTSVTYFRVFGLNTISVLTTTPWFTGSMRYVNIASNLTTAEVDNLLIALSSATAWAAVAQVDLQESGNAPRSSASDAAVATITSRGATVLTN